MPTIWGDPAWDEFERLRADIWDDNEYEDPLAKLVFEPFRNPEAFLRRLMAGRARGLSPWESISPRPEEINRAFLQHALGLPEPPLEVAQPGASGPAVSNSRSNTTEPQPQNRKLSGQFADYEWDPRQQMYILRKPEEPIYPTTVFPESRLDDYWHTGFYSPEYERSLGKGSDLSNIWK